MLNSKPQIEQGGNLSTSFLPKSEQIPPIAGLCPTINTHSALAALKFCITSVLEIFTSLQDIALFSPMIAGILVLLKSEFSVVEYPDEPPAGHP